MIKTIKLTEEEIEFIRISTENMDAAHVGFQEACILLNGTQKQLWEEIEKIYPEAIGKSKRAKINKEKFEIVYFDDE